VANIKPKPSAFWLNYGVLTPQEIDGLRKSNYNVTEFVQPINTNNKTSIEAAIETVQEHHFGQNVWVEYVPNL
jgi:hypothetical protein